MRFVMVVGLTTVGICALLVCVTGTCHANVSSPPEWLVGLGEATFVGSPVIGAIIGFLIWRLDRKHNP